MREKIALLLTGAACALGGVALSGGVAGAERGRAAGPSLTQQAVNSARRTASNTQNMSLRLNEIQDDIHAIHGGRTASAGVGLDQLLRVLKAICQGAPEPNSGCY